MRPAGRPGRVAAARDAGRGQRRPLGQRGDQTGRRGAGHAPGEPQRGARRRPSSRSTRCRCPPVTSQVAPSGPRAARRRPAGPATRSGPASTVVPTSSPSRVTSSHTAHRRARGPVGAHADRTGDRGRRGARGAGEPVVRRRRGRRWPGPHRCSRRRAGRRARAGRRGGSPRAPAGPDRARPRTSRPTGRRPRTAWRCHVGRGHDDREHERHAQPEHARARPRPRPPGAARGPARAAAPGRRARARPPAGAGRTGTRRPGRGWPGRALGSAPTRHAPLAATHRVPRRRFGRQCADEPRPRSRPAVPGGTAPSTTALEPGPPSHRRGQRRDDRVVVELEEEHQRHELLVRGVGPAAAAPGAAPSASAARSSARAGPRC